MAEEWFRDWFNSKYYHILYHYRDEKEAERLVKNLMGFLKLQKGSKIIDIACGKGRHALYLSKLKFEVVGIDLSESSIEYAREHQCEGLKFFCHDKRKVFRKSYFDCGLNLFTSFGYLENRTELNQAFQNMASNVRLGGIFVMDFFNSYKIKDQQPENETLVIENINFNIRKEVRNGQVCKQINILDGGNTISFEEKVHLISKEEFHEMFELSGLKILHTFGDYSLQNFIATDSDRLILIGEKID